MAATPGTTETVAARTCMDDTFRMNLAFVLHVSRSGVSVTEALVYTMWLLCRCLHHVRQSSLSLKATATFLCQTVVT